MPGPIKDRFPYDEETIEVPNACPVCLAGGETLGTLGSRVHYRCHNCGMDFSTHNKQADHRVVGGED